MHLQCAAPESALGKAQPRSQNALMLAARGAAPGSSLTTDVIASLPCLATPHASHGWPSRLKAREHCCGMLPGSATPECAHKHVRGPLQVKRVATHCHGATVLLRVLQRILLHYALRWRRRQREGRLCV